MPRVVRKPGPGEQVLKQFLDGIKGDKVGKVGWFESAKYNDGTPVAYVATINEFGCPEKNIPARPTVRPTIAEQQGNWRRLAAQGAKAILAGRYTVAQVLEGIGLQAVGDIKKTISKLTSPALKESTVKNRLRRRADRKTIGGLTKPLVDTGRMLNSLTNVVEDK